MAAMGRERNLESIGYDCNFREARQRRIPIAYQLLVAGFNAQNFRPAGGFGQLPVFTHDTASDERFCAEMAALS